MAKQREDLIGQMFKKECNGYIIDGVIVKTFMSKQEQIEANIVDKLPNSLIRCNLCGNIQSIRNDHFKNKSYRCNCCKGYGDLFNKKYKETEWTPIRIATDEEMLAFNKENKKGIFLWCKCSCGHEQPVDVKNLKNNESTKCKNCSIKNSIHPNVAIGDKYNMLTIVELTDKKNRNGNYLVRCECECGNTQYYTTFSELNNGRKSCGCLQYNSDLTDEERKIKRNYPSGERFRYQVKAKANYICDCCGYKGHKHDGIMKAHHLNGWHWYDKDKRDSINNGVCLCQFCHDEFHIEYGQKNNTKEQYEDFKNIKARQEEYWHKNNTVKPDKVERKCTGSGRTYIGKDKDNNIIFIGKKQDIDNSIYNYSNVCLCISPNGKQKTHGGLYWSIQE